jgi:esterase/lipase superfamily enzyme
MHVVTHSMGGRLAAIAMDALSAEPPEARPHLYHLILAAPDIRVNLFEQSAPAMEVLSKRMTLYASEWDQALRCSFWFHNAPRAGQGGQGAVVIKGLDTIDASPVEKPSLVGRIPCTPSGHSYISQNPAVLSDFFELLSHDTDPGNRQRLHEEKKGPLVYWLLK